MLLYKMTNLKNVEVIVDKMMNYLKHTTLENQSKKDILQKITELTERFAPNKTWFIKIMNDLFVNFGDMITDDILSKLVGIISEWENETDDLEEFKKYTIENYASIVENYSVLPESFVKLMAWVIGEYTCKLYLNDTEKIKGIIQMLSYLLNKTYDDEMTKCLLISAIAKINSNINFSEQNLVNDIIERYSRDKNVELQQRCLEYKRTQIRNNPIEKNSFTKIEENPNIDFNLSFLNDYVREKSDKIYDPNISEMYMEKFSSNEVQLNVGPYAINSTILSMPSKGGDINKLYENKGENFVETMKAELKVKAEQKWGVEGYKEEAKKEEKPSFLNLQGISSSSRGYGGNNYESNKSYNNQGNKRIKKEEELNPESQEKKQLMKELFGGFSGEKEDKPKMQIKKNNQNLGNNINNNNNKGNINLFEGMTQINKGNNNNNQKNQNNNININNKNNENNNSGNVDLLGFGDSQPQSQNNINSNNAPGSIDLLGEIFGGNVNNNNQNNINNIQNQAQQNQDNIFDIFGNNNNNSQNIINNNINNNSNNINNTFNNNMNFFNNFNAQNTNMNNNIYTPYNIDTDQFGQLWEKYPDESSYEINTNISTPQQFHEIIKSKGNFAAIDIINNEAISAANYKNQISLIYATVDPGHLVLLVKNQNQGLNEEVAKYVMDLFK